MNLQNETIDYGICKRTLLQLQGSYLFSEVARKVKAFEAAHPQVRLIRLGIGDVTRPLPQACIEGDVPGRQGTGGCPYIPRLQAEQGYDFLIKAILKHDFEERGITLSPSEIFISDGAKSDLGNLTELFRQDNLVAITDPVYPVYVDSNVMCGRAGVAGADGLWSKVTYLPCTGENGFVPELPDHRVDLVYLCYPNNPTGTTLTREQLKKWVDYALDNDALILFDAAYEAFISEPDVPHSIYEIPGAEQVAIEVRSFSKTAGFTGVRCGYTVVPEKVTARTEDGRRVALNPLWNRRQCTKFNGTSYITQRGAEAIYTPEGRRQVEETIAYYKENARIMREGFREAGLTVYGGVNSPYLWLKAPEGMTSWEFFDHLLHEMNVVGTPGSGFGPSGEGYLRLTAFGQREDCLEAMERIRRKGFSSAGKSSL